MPHVQVGNCPISLLCQGRCSELPVRWDMWSFPGVSFAGNCPITFVSKPLDRGYPGRIHRWCLVETSSGAWKKRWMERWWWKHVETDFVMISCKRCFPSKSIYSRSRWLMCRLESPTFLNAWPAWKMARRWLQLNRVDWEATINGEND